MKKLFLTIITLTIIASTGCYDANSAKVRINLGNMPIAHNTQKSFIDSILGIFEKDAYASPLSSLVSQVTTVHIAAFSGDTLLVSKSINAEEIDAVENQTIDCSVELYVPAGEDIDIIVIGEFEYSVQGEGTARMISYFGHNTDTINLKAGDTMTVPVTMSTTYFSSMTFSWHQDTQPWSVSWEKIPGAVVVISGDLEGEIYRGTGTTAYYNQGDQVWTGYAQFSFADLSVQLPL